MLPQGSKKLKCKAARLLRDNTEIDTAIVSIDKNSINKNKSQGQPRIYGRGNRQKLLMEEVASAYKS